MRRAPNPSLLARSFWAQEKNTNIATAEAFLPHSSGIEDRMIMAATAVDPHNESPAATCDGLNFLSAR